MHLDDKCQVAHIRARGNDNKVIGSMRQAQSSGKAPKNLEKVQPAASAAPAFRAVGHSLYGLSQVDNGIEVEQDADTESDTDGSNMGDNGKLSLVVT